MKDTQDPDLKTIDRLTAEQAASITDEEDEIEAGITQSYKTSDLGVIPSDTPLAPERFEKFKETVFASRPTIGSIYHDKGQTPLYTYSKNQVRENRNKTIKARKPELSKTVHEQVRKVLGVAIADSVVKQLKTNDSVSTVQKTSPLGHPDTLNATLMNALPYFNQQHPSFSHILVFACAGISFNNTKFPRGHLFHTFTENEIHTDTVTLFGHTVDSRPIMFHPPYSPTGITEAKNALQQLKRENKLNRETEEKILGLLDTIYASPHALSLDDYVDQLTVTNYHLFNALFADYTKSKPSLIFLSQEKIALALLIEHHLNQDTAIHRLLFNPEYYPLIEKYFEGITGAFVKDKKIGTYLFWGLPKDAKYRTQLWRDGNTLKSEDGRMTIELTPDRVREAILKKEIFPSILLTFVILAMYYGLLLGGGYEQTMYLTKIKEKYIALMNEVGDTESASAVAELTTTNLVIPRPILTYVSNQDTNARIPATTLDMLLYSAHGRSWNKLLEASKQVTLSQVIERTLPSLYREYAMHKPNAEDFINLTERDVEILNGLDRSIIPVISR